MIARFLALLALLAVSPAHAADVTIPNLPPAYGVSDADLFLKWDGTQQSGQRTQRLTAGLLAAYLVGKVPVMTLSPAVSMLTPGSAPTATVTGTWPALTLTLGIPYPTPAAIGAAARGANSDITSLFGLTTALSVAQGGTGSTTASAARTALAVTPANIGAAASGANSDITALSGLTTALPISEGGTGSATAANARTALGVTPANIGAAASGANSDVTSLSGLTTPLSAAQGGTGDNGGAWTATSATASASSGTIGTNTVAIRTKKIGRTVFMDAKVSITSAGTSPGGFLTFPVPYAGVSGASFVGAAREGASTGKMGFAQVDTTTCAVQLYDGTSATGNGYVVSLTVVYEAAS